MIVDMHIHVAGKSDHYGNHIDESFFNSWLFSKVLKQYKIEKKYPFKSNREFDEKVIEQVTKLIDDSILDYGMILALDAAYNEDGERLQPLSQLIVSNDYVFEFAKRSKKILCGCSVHPYRKDAIEELKRCIANGAKAIKWLPSAQNIDLENEKCIPFYECLKEHNIPLLIHIGREHTLKSIDHRLNNISKLELPLSMGVTVIAAHLGARLMLHEKCFFKKWCKLTEKYHNLYGDVSAFTVPTRTGYISKLLKSKELSKRILYGSDFPCVNFPIFFLHKIGLSKYLEIKQETNIFNETYMCYNSLGLTDEMFNRFLKIGD